MASPNHLFAQRLLDLAQKRGLKNQRALAEALGVSDNAITNYVKKSRVPEWDVLVKIAALFEVSCDYLLTGAAPGQPVEAPTLPRPAAIVLPRGEPAPTPAEAELVRKALRVLRAKGPGRKYADTLAGNINLAFDSLEMLAEKSSGLVRAKVAANEESR